MRYVYVASFLLAIIALCCMPVYYTPDASITSPMTPELGVKYYFQIEGREKPIAITLKKTRDKYVVLTISHNNGNNAPAALTKSSEEDMEVQLGTTRDLWEGSSLSATYAGEEVIFAWGANIQVMRMHYLVEKLIPERN